jgi:dTDP-4-amino-4,6-dideoxygalactose transaminase
LDGFIAHKEALYNFYFERLDGKNGLHILGWRPGTRPNRWFFSVDMKDSAVSRDDLIRILAENKIQSRSIWDLIHEQAPYRGSLTAGIEKAVDYQSRIVNIPCSTNLSFEDAARVVEVILNATQVR